MPHHALYLPSLESGGVQSVFIAVARGLADLGNRISILTHDAAGPRAADLQDFTDLVALGGQGDIGRIRHLSRWIDSARPDALLTGMWSANVRVILARELAQHRPRLVISDHNAILTRLAAPEFRAWAVYAAARACYWRADAMIAVSEGVARQSARAFPEWRGRIRTVYNPVIDERFARNLAQHEEHPWFAPGQPPVIAALSRLAPIKNFSMLLESYADFLSQTGHPARLMIIGDGPTLPRLQQIARSRGITDRVFFAGHRSNPLPLLKQAALFVHPSLREGFGNVIVEAMACGVPVLATDCPEGPREILEGGRLGHLIPPGDRGALAAGLAAALASPIRPDPACLGRFRAEAITREYGRILDGTA